MVSSTPAATGKRAAPAQEKGSKAKAAKRVAVKSKEDTPEKSVDNINNAVASPHESPPRQPSAAAPSDAPPVDPFLKECAPVLQLLDRAADLPEATREMMRAAAPFSLRTPKATRDAMQEHIASSLIAICKGVEAGGAAAVEAKQAAVNELGAERAALLDKQSAAVFNVAEFAKKRDAVGAAVKESSTVAITTREALSQTRRQREDLEAEQSAVESEKEKADKLLTETWLPLKAGQTFKHRARMVDQVLKALEPTGLEESLKGALPVVLRQKPEERGSYAQKAVNFSEESLRERVASFEAKLAGFAEPLALRTSCVSAAQEALSTAEGLREERMSNLVKAEDELCDAQTKEQESNDAMKAFVPKERQATEAVAQAKEEFATIMMLVKRVEDINEAGEGYLNKAPAKVMLDDDAPRFAGEEPITTPMRAGA